MSGSSRSQVACSSERPVPVRSCRNFGDAARDSGHSLVPAPPAGITAQKSSFGHASLTWRECEPTHQRSPPAHPTHPRVLPTGHPRRTLESCASRSSPSRSCRPQRRHDQRLPGPGVPARRRPRGRHPRTTSRPASYAGTRARRRLGPGPPVPRGHPPRRESSHCWPRSSPTSCTWRHPSCSGPGPSPGPPPRPPQRRGLPDRHALLPAAARAGRGGAGRRPGRLALGTPHPRDGRPHARPVLGRRSPDLTAHGIPRTALWGGCGRRTVPPLWRPTPAPGAAAHARPAGPGPGRLRRTAGPGEGAAPASPSHPTAGLRPGPRGRGPSRADDAAAVAAAGVHAVFLGAPLGRRPHAGRMPRWTCSSTRARRRPSGRRCRRPQRRASRWSHPPVADHSTSSTTASPGCSSTPTTRPPCARRSLHLAGDRHEATRRWAKPGGSRSPVARGRR